jgi:hypothetical protein
LLQLGKALAFDAKSLVIGEVPVQDIHLHSGQAINVALDDFDRLPMTGHVHHQPAPREARLVLNTDGRQEILTVIRRD